MSVKTFEAMWDEVVARVAAAQLTAMQVVDAGIQGVYSMYGHPQEIINILAQKDQVQAWQYKKYPLLALMEDLPKDPPDLPGYDYKATVQVIIAHQTQPEYIASERIASTFTPILIPLYTELMRQLRRYPNFFIPRLKRGTRIDRLYWGKQGLQGSEGLVFNDHLDAIEIKDLTIYVRENACENTRISNLF